MEALVSTLAQYGVPAVLAGAPISEAGLVDETGRVVAIQHFGAKVIDAGTTWEYHWEEEAR